MAALRKVLLAPFVLVPALLVLAIGAYAALGFWGVPWLVRSQANAYVHDTLHRDLQLGEVTFNPFTFRLTLRDAMIVERGKPLVGMRHLLADYQAVSLFKGEHVLREVALDRPYARAILQRDGSLNLAEIRHNGARLEANEVHVHLLGRTDEQRWQIELDLCTAQEEGF